ncbi:DnaB-like helicase N-terminal domain-containing protein [Amycolatopsis coloradensis]|uniref:DnaB-like helicase N-terminal domain-containing protein n=1 Tax=Amycolatopsis coloradensis TaxID=76021 RepID=UPI0013011AC5|nr:DnaB-like helicase N-terminal domain-containing protein [Amycolatopsis coloradensis]
MSGATRLAERAVVGALLNRPDRLADVQAWLQPHDFADPDLRAVYSALQGLHRQGRLRSVSESELVGADRSPDTRDAIIHNVFEIKVGVLEGAEAHAARFSSLLTELYRATPPSATPQHARYGRMVLESSARRQIEQWSLQMQSVVATGENVSGTSTVAALQQSDIALREDLSGIRAQMDRHAGRGRLDTVDPVQPRQTPAPPAVPPPPTLVERSELRMIGAALREPRPELLERFEPQDFTSSPAHANTWRAILALASTRPPTPIDPITVAWETEKLSARFGEGLPGDDLMILASHPPGAVNDSTISVVIQASLYQRAQEASAVMRAAAQDRGQHLDDVLRTAQLASGSVRAEAERLITPAASGQSLITRGLDGPPTTRTHHAPAPDTQPRGRPR